VKTHLRITQFALIIPILLLAITAVAAETGIPDPVVKKTLPAEIHTECLNPEYFFYQPQSIGNKEPLPLLIYLHGKGERGTKIWKVRKHGPLKKSPDGIDFPFAILAPQCLKDEEGQGWWKTEDLQLLLQHVMATENIDPKRITLSGNSMGGAGTLAWASAHPTQFAAIAPICGATSENFDPSPLKELPIWIFHGAKDPIVPLKRSQDIVDALTAIGSSVKFTIYPEAKHDSWSESYTNPELYQWLLEHSAAVGFKNDDPHN